MYLNVSDFALKPSNGLITASDAAVGQQQRDPQSVTDTEPNRSNARAGRRRARRLAAGMAVVLACAGALPLRAQDPGAAAPPRAAVEAGAIGTAHHGAAFGRFGFDDSAIDPAIRPGDSFFDYANGAWVARTPIPADESSAGMFDTLVRQAEEQVRAIVTDAAGPHAPAGTDTGKIGGLYNAFMDEGRVEKLDLAPIAAELAAIREAGTRNAIAAIMGRARQGVGQSLFSISVSEDEKDPTRYTLHASQSGLGLPDRDYYLRDAFKDKKAAYRDYVARLLDMAGWPDAQQRADDVVAFETRIAEASWSRAESRDPEKTYNPMTRAELVALAPDFPWDTMLDAAGVGDLRTVVVGQKSAFPKIAKVFAETPVATLQAWWAFGAVDDAAPYLSSRFVKARFDFRGRMLAGLDEQQPRWRRAVHLIESALGEAVGREYVARHFPPASKARMEELVGEVKRALHARIENLAWMTPATKARALEKLDLLGVKIGYPVKWRDYTALAIDPADLMGDVRRAGAFAWAEDVAKLKKPVDPLEWSTTPQTVNAYYEPSRNEIVFPAAILQPPFFDPEADMAINFGGIGGVIGHEMTHAFDDQGRKSDGHGVLTDWWQPADAVRFQAEAARLGAQFDAYAVAPGVNLKGDQTMGENIADLGGILLALDAYHASLHGAPAPVLGGLTGDQRVFLGWAQVWRAKTRPDTLKLLATSDAHAPERFRVDGPLRNVDAWYDAFGIKPGDQLYLKPEDRVRIW
jgi:putative endopeptidase